MQCHTHAFIESSSDKMYEWIDVVVVYKQSVNDEHKVVNNKQKFTLKKQNRSISFLGIYTIYTVLY